MRKIFLLLLLTLVLLPMSAQKKPEKYTELYYQRASLFDQLPIDSTDIVFLGNSLTHGCEWHELFGMPNIKNRGINGDIVEGLRLRIDPIIKGQPAKLFILTGVNDVSHNLTADSIAGALGNLIDIVRAGSPRTKVYVQSLLPINNSFGRYKAIKGKEQVVRDINHLLEPMVKEKGCTWINSYPIFVDADGNLDARFTNDGLHLMGNGYLHWRDFLRSYVLE